MPRADTKPLSQYSYASDSGSYPQSDCKPSSSPPSSSSSSATQKKKHICPTCERAFTTSGHLARHSRVHTGERNHKCPFPGCETRCSRQDNLQQHYRIHLSPGSRRSSTRSAIARAMNSSCSGKRSSTSSMEPQIPPPPMTPPALEPARLYASHSTPPDTPPPLTPATLPPSMHLADPVSSRSTSPPDGSSSYPSNHHHMMSMPSSSMGLANSYSYRNSTSTYQEPSQGAAGFTYVHTTPIHSTSNSPSNFSYSQQNQHASFNSHHSMTSSSAVIHNNTRHNSEPNISGIASRHSISHISHPNSYSHLQQHHSSSGGPPSPASSHSVSSHTSGPPTPTYPVFHDDVHSYHHHHGSGLLSNNDANHHHSHMGVPSHLLHPSNMYQQQQHQHHPAQQSSHGLMGLGPGRFVDSPPPTLAPIQDERYIRRDDRHSTSASPYIHHPQPLSSEYPYHHQPLGLTANAWKSEHSLRKGVGALVQ